MAQMKTLRWQAARLAATSLLLLAPARAQFGKTTEFARPFSIYATEAARSLAERADQHLQAGRISDAIVDLQTLLEDHPGEVLPASRPLHKGLRSEGDVHRGAADHARRRLLELDQSARDFYVQRYGKRAKAALDAARETGDRRALTQVARRWPLTGSAEQAWWALGDLELEIGNRLEALRAWEQALGLALGNNDTFLERAQDWRAIGQDSPRPLSEGARARIELAAQLLEGQAPGGRDLHDHPSSALGSALGPPIPPGPEETLQPPGRGADGWRVPFQLPAEHPFDRPDGRFSLYPARSEDALFVSTGLELYCVNAYTGELSWRSGEPRGWGALSARERVDFLDAVERQESLIVPAVAQGIVITGLQIPHSFESKIDYGEMSIIKQIPNRRLFAFDARSGKPLWNTEPPLLWDGESGDFSDRMRMVGSPIISGSRVLVPTARLRGRIEYHVGCFDLFTGELLWSTAVITGQRERNMFGRAVREFAAPPLVVAGRQVIAQTQLGAVAALNLFTGDLMWESLYEKIPLREARNFSAPQRKIYWRNAPPIIVGDTIVATPDDSEYLIAIDRASGALVWSHHHDSISRLGFQDTYFDVLLGADEHTVYLGGRRVLAIDFPLGIGTGEQPASRRWTWPATRTSNLLGRAPRPILTATRLWIPEGETLVGVDRETGKQLEVVPCKSGNILVGEGLLYTLMSDRLDGKFEWTRLLDQARTRQLAAPGDMGEALTLAQLLEERGRTEAAQGHYQDSSKHLAEARAVIESFTEGDQSEAHPRLRARLHAILRAEASTSKALGNGQLALERLARARDLAPDRTALRDTLLEELDLLAPRDTSAWLATLESLDSECPDMEIRVDTPHGLSAALQEGRLNRYLPGPDSRPGDAQSTQTMPIGLWLRIARVLRLEGDARGEQAFEQIFEDLHSILAHYGRRRIDGLQVGDWAKDRIGDRLRRGLRDGYEAFEGRATDLYLDAKKRGDGQQLERVSEFYPHSEAAQTASDTRARIALSNGEAEVLARIALGELTDSWDMAHASERDLRHLQRMASVFGAVGNLELRAGLATAMLASHASAACELEGFEGKSLRELEGEWRLPQAPLPAGATAAFDAELGISRGLGLKGSFQPLGEVPAAVGTWPAGAGHVVLFADDADRLVALGSVESSPGTEELPLKRWERVLRADETPGQWVQRFAASAGRAHLATFERVLTVERDKGTVLWSWQDEGARAERRSTNPERIAASDGVVVVTLTEKSADRALRGSWLVALDAGQGIELWRRELDTRSFSSQPLLGEGKLCLLPTYPADLGLVLDLFSGHIEAQFRVPSVSQNITEAAWIDAGQLFLPRFLERRPDLNMLSAVDLRSGREAWRVDFEGMHGGCQLTRLLRYAGDTFLVVEPKLEGGVEGGIYSLDTRTGLASSTPLALFARQDRWLGLRYKSRTDLDSPYVFQLTLQSLSEPLRLRAVHLPYGRRWEVPIRLMEADICRETFPRPGLSSSTVVIGWREAKASAGSRQYETVVTILDRNSGSLRGTRSLHPEMDGSQILQLVPLGDSLVLCGDKKLEVWR